MIFLNLYDCQHLRKYCSWDNSVRNPAICQEIKKAVKNIVKLG